MGTPVNRRDPASKISARARAVESSGIRRVFDLGARLKDPINFSIGQPDFAVPLPVVEAAKQAIERGHNSYTPTQGIAALREKVAEKLARDNGIETLPDDVLITSGSSGGIFLVLAAILDPGDEVIVPDPYFVMYPQLTRFFGAVPVFVDTYPDFQLDPDRIEDAVTNRTKAIVINSPNNPTGAVYPESTLKAVADVAYRYGLLIVSDEVYEPFVYDGVRHISVGSVYPPTVTLNAFSKSHALTGWRIGYATGPSPIVEKMKELQQYTFVCAPTPAQYAALTALDLGPSEEVNAFERRRDLIYEGLRARFDVTRPQGAFYIMPRVSDDDATEFVERAIGQNVLVIPGSVFSNRKTHVRLSFATSEEKIQRGLEALNALATPAG